MAITKGWNAGNFFHLQWLWAPATFIGKPKEIPNSSISCLQIAYISNSQVEELNQVGFFLMFKASSSAKFVVFRRWLQNWSQK